MNIALFNKLSNKEKLTLISLESIKVGEYFTRFGETNLITCYSYKNFFIDITLRINTKEIIEIVAFNNGIKLDKYLPKNLLKKEY